MSIEALYRKYKGGGMATCSEYKKLIYPHQQEGETNWETVKRLYAHEIRFQEIMSK